MRIAVAGPGERAVKGLNYIPDAMDKARLHGKVVALTLIWARLDGYGLRNTGPLSHAV